MIALNTPTVALPGVSCTTSIAKLICTFVLFTVSKLNDDIVANFFAPSYAVEIFDTVPDVVPESLKFTTALAGAPGV